MVFNIKGEDLELLSDKAIYWEKNDTLIIADLHIGKAAHFRKNGIQVPAMVERNNLWRLSGLVVEKKPAKMIFLGDLSHSEKNAAWDQFADFCQNFPEIKLILIKGNHDIISSHHFSKANIEVMDEYSIGPFLLTHDREESDLYNIHGHIHPAIRLKGRARQSVRVPCFFFSEEYAVLPSFGDFTGSFVLSPKKGDTVFYPGETEVLRIF